jgi:hypothetical protein
MNAGQSNFSIETVCSLPAGLTADAMTSDGHVVAIWPQEDGTLRFSWDGIAGVVFDGIGEMADKSPTVFCSADGAHIAYVGERRDRQERIFVGHDNREDPPVAWFSRSVPPTFSPDGRHLAYGGGTPDAMRLILDGEPIGDQQLAPVAAVFSPDGERLAYVEVRGEKRMEAEMRIVLDGAPGEWCFGMRNSGGVMQFSPDSRRFAYCRSSADLKVQWVVDGVPQRIFDEVPHLSMARLRGVGVLEPPLAARFSPDSRRFAYFADVPEKGVAIVEDDVAGPVLKAVGRPVFSPDSRHLAYMAQTFDGRATVVVDGVAAPPWNAKTFHGLPVFSADGRHVAVTAMREEGGLLRKRHTCVLVVDGRVVAELPGEDVSAIPVVNADGSHVAWWVRQGPAAKVMLDGEPVPAGTYSASEPVFTPSGRLAYATHPDGGAPVTVMLHDRPGPIAERMAPNRTVIRLFGRSLEPKANPDVAISPDGEHVAWMGMFRGCWAPVLDDQVGPPFTWPVACWFEPDGRATWYLQLDDTVCRVTARPG